MLNPAPLYVTLTLIALLACGPSLPVPTDNTGGSTGDTGTGTGTGCDGDRMAHRPLGSCEDLSDHPLLGAGCCEPAAPSSCVLPTGEVCEDARVIYPPPPSEYAGLGMWVCCDPE